MHTHYGRLYAMAGLSFLAMYVLMYAMTDSLANVYANINQFYMAGLMAAPMVIIELLLMQSMYPNKKMNAAIMGIAIVAMAGFYAAIRQQTLIADSQFLRSMIPHHSGAILMCDQADLQDPEIRKLCERIRASQQSEIEQMKTILARLAE